MSERSKPIGTYPMPRHGWTCFHCGETFTTPGAARDHFGADSLAEPGCRIKAGEELGLLMALRKAEAELERYRAEDSDKDRQMAAMAADYGQALQREEEKGYERGLRDGAAERNRLLAVMVAAARSERAVAAQLAGDPQVFEDWPEMDALVAALDEVAPGWRDKPATERNAAA